MSALARWCYQHRFVVITAWIGLLIGLAVMSQAVKTSYDNSLTLPGTGSGNAQQLLLRSAPAQAGYFDQILLPGSPRSLTPSAIQPPVSAVAARGSPFPHGGLRRTPPP